ncbi:MAG TPA: HD domain-containing protein [Candidatus Acidoferrum sp.]|nr:HD domain-containing protein [Candidatus Acidoferrum sp.]
MKVIRDNVHGDIEFYPEEMRLLRTAEFERLHGCRQLGLSHLIYPGAKHSRFEHVLGVMHVATKIALRMREQRVFFLSDKNGEELFHILRFSALLHDMGHVPFGHTLEDEMPIIAKHDESSEETQDTEEGPKLAKAAPQVRSRMDLAVTAALRASNNEAYVQPVLQVLRAIAESKNDLKLHSLVEKGKIKPEYLVLADIIGNTICADLLDYIRRDHMMAGIEATYDPRIFRYFGVKEYKGYKRAVVLLVKTGRLRNDALADLLDILKLRYNLSDKVLFHPKKCAADAMLIRAVGEAGLTADDLMNYSDDGLLDHLREHPLIRMIREWNLYKPVFICGLTQINTYGQDHKKTELIEELHKEVSLRQKIETRIQKELGLPGDRTSVLIFCPRPKMTLKPVRALVRWKDGTVWRLNDIGADDDRLTHNQVKLLEDIYSQLWKLYLFVDPALRNHAEAIRSKFCSILKEVTGLSATCDLAFEHYLERCPDVKIGRLLDEKVASHKAVAQLPIDQRQKIILKCHQRIPPDPNSDEYAEQDAEVLASRKDDAVFLRRLDEIVDRAVEEELNSKRESQLQMDLDRKTSS